MVLNYLKNNLVVLFNYIGEFAPIIIMLYSVYLLSSKINLLLYYIYGTIANTILNVVIKNITQQPRPLDDPTLFNIALKNGHNYMFKNNIPTDLFGMPSGHAENLFFSLFFISFALKAQNISLIICIITLISCIQRYNYNYHSLFQLFVGSIIGSCIGILFYNFSQHRIIKTNEYIKKQK